MAVSKRRCANFVLLPFQLHVTKPKLFQRSLCQLSFVSLLLNINTNTHQNEKKNKKLKRGTCRFCFLFLFLTIF